MMVWKYTIFTKRFKANGVILKQHKFVWSLHYYNDHSCIYKGKVKFDNGAWNFVSAGSKTTTRKYGYIYLVCESAKCIPGAWSGE